MVDAAAEVTGNDIPIREVPRREGDAPKLVSGSTLAREKLGWQPKRSDLRAMIADAWGWHRTGKYAS